MKYWENNENNSSVPYQLDDNNKKNFVEVFKIPYA
jgi:hypothetical protein